MLEESHSLSNMSVHVQLLASTKRGRDEDLDLHPWMETRCACTTYFNLSRPIYCISERVKLEAWMEEHTVQVKGHLRLAS